MDYGRRSDRYDESPPRHRAPTPRSADRVSTGTTESTYVHDGKDYYTTAHRRQVSDSDRPQYREEKYYYELPPRPRKTTTSTTRKSSGAAARRTCRARSPTRRIPRSEDRNHHNQRRHSQQQHPRDKKTISSTKKSDTMGGLDLNWKQAAEAAAGAAAVEAWRSHGNRDQIKRCDKHQDRWRSGSASDSSPEGHPFKSGPVQLFALSSPDACNYPIFNFYQQY
ncbi:hypothetical protein PG990_001759 [Apiospora arundinis]